MEWVKALKALLTGLASFVKKYHQAGPSWNPSGIPVSSFKPGTPWSFPLRSPSHYVGLPTLFDKDVQRMVARQTERSNLSMLFSLVTATAVYAVFLQASNGSFCTSLFIFQFYYHLLVEERDSWNILYIPYVVELR